MNTNPHEVSERLFALRRMFSEHIYSGVTMDGEQVSALIIELKEVGILANAMEHRLTYDNWNRPKREQLIDVKDMVSAQQFDSNIRFFTNVKRRHGDNAPKPKGAA